MLNFETISKDKFSTAINIPVFNGESRQQEQSTDWMLEFKAVAGVRGVESLLKSKFDKEIPSSDCGCETYEADEFLFDSGGRKHKSSSKVNAKAINLFVASVKGVTWRKII